MKNNLFRTVVITLFLLFIGLYYASNVGIIDYQAKNKTVLTEEQIKLFEQDVKNNENIDIKKYIHYEDEKYNNNISKTTLKISNTIGKTVDNILNFLFSKMEKTMNQKK